MEIQKLDIATASDKKIKEAFSKFLKRDFGYREKYLQSSYKKAFDGYSYMGQKDSSNQYENDKLHSFVLSEFHNTEDFPEEFQDFMNNEWKEIKQKVRNIELEIIKKSNIAEAVKLYEDDVIGYMMSCNFYPKPTSYRKNKKPELRLSSHKDISLFTVFPYGVSKGFSYQNASEENIGIEQKEKIIMFSGYFAEFITNGKMPALDHRVDLPENLNSERYSFALFSIPKPNKTFWHNNEKIKSEEYYSKYLSLF